VNAEEGKGVIADMRAHQAACCRELKVSHSAEKLGCYDTCVVHMPSHLHIAESLPHACALAVSLLTGVSLFRAPKPPFRRPLAPFRYLGTDRDASNGPGLTSLSTLSVSTLSVSILSVSTLCFVERWFLKEKAPLVCAFRFSPRATPTDMWGSACQSYLHTPSERERE